MGLRTWYWPPGEGVGGYRIRARSTLVSQPRTGLLRVPSPVTKTSRILPTIACCASARDADSALSGWQPLHIGRAEPTARPSCPRSAAGRPLDQGVEAGVDQDPLKSIVEDMARRARLLFARHYQMALPLPWRPSVIPAILQTDDQQWRQTRWILPICCTSQTGSSAWPPRVWQRATAYALRSWIANLSGIRMAAIQKPRRRYPEVGIYLWFNCPAGIMDEEDAPMTHKALLVGINDYAPAGAGGPDLRGCLNDVKDFANTMGALGIVPIHPRTMRILTDRNATRANILAGIKWLLAGAKKETFSSFTTQGMARMSWTLRVMS